MTDTSIDYEDNIDFYTLYANYLVEARVRKVHDAVLKAVCPHPALRRVIDLGCGKGNEFFHYARPKSEFYVGIDQNADEKHTARQLVTKGNYRDLSLVKELIQRYGLTAVISLFSAEITQPMLDNHAYYEALFRDTDIEVMLIGGFYYEHAKGEETKEEPGGLVSYQTPGEISRPTTELFHETRIEIPCPSTLFGEDVVEVWRLLQRIGQVDEQSVRALLDLSPKGFIAGTRVAGK